MTSVPAPTRHPRGKSAAGSSRLLHEAARHEQLAADVAHPARWRLHPPPADCYTVRGTVEFEPGPDGHTALAHSGDAHLSPRTACACPR